MFRLLLAAASINGFKPIHVFSTQNRSDFFQYIFVARAFSEKHLGEMVIVTYQTTL